MITEPSEEEARGGMTEGEKHDLVSDDFKKTARDLGQVQGGKRDVWSEQ